MTYLMKLTITDKIRLTLILLLIKHKKPRGHIVFSKIEGCLQGQLESTYEQRCKSSV